MLAASMITVARKGQQYVYDSLDSFHSNAPEIPVHLYVGSLQSEFVQRYKDSKSVIPHIPISAEYTPLERESLRHRAVWNYWRALTLSHSEDYIIVMEDDIQFSRRWYEYLHIVINKVRSETDRFALTLYVPGTSESGKMPFLFPCDAYRDGKMFTSYPSDKFYGTQAVVYPKVVQDDLAAYFKNSLDSKGKLPIDWLVKKYVLERRIQLFATAPVVVQHIGMETTGLAGRSHQSLCFVEDVGNLLLRG